MAGERGSPVPDPYELLGVERGAGQQEIARAWRRQALAAHPDTRAAQDRGDETAGRFRALAGAYHLLSDPGRRAAYDRALAAGPEAAPNPRAIPVPVRLVSTGGTTAPHPVPGPPLRAGPVRVERLPGYPATSEDHDDARLAILAGLALHWLARGRHRPW